MSSKEERLNLLRQILETKKVGGQRELLAELQRSGYGITQATLSRDLKLLKAAKSAGMNGEYLYTLYPAPSYHRIPDYPTKERPLGIGFISLSFSGNIAVLHTLPGFANSVATILDKALLPFLLGTIAGDDTVMIVLREGCSHAEIQNELQNIIPQISENS